MVHDAACRLAAFADARAIADVETGAVGRTSFVLDQAVAGIVCPKMAWQVAFEGVTRLDDHLQLGVGKRSDGPVGEHRTIARRGGWHGRHRQRLNQGIRMGIGAVDVDACKSPGCVDSAGLAGGADLVANVVCERDDG